MNPERDEHMHDQALSPALKSWIKDCIVPILVREYITTLRNQVESERAGVVESHSGFNFKSATAVGVSN